MKTATALPAPALPHKPTGKKLLAISIIHLTSEKLFTFASVIAAHWSWWGVCTDDAHAIACGAVVWLAAFILWEWRQTARDLRKARLGLK